MARMLCEVLKHTVATVDIPLEAYRERLLASGLAPPASSRSPLMAPGWLRKVATPGREPHWLDWALQRLGISGGFRSLLSQPSASPGRPHALLWTPTASR